MYKSTKFRGNLKRKCILLVDLTWNYPLTSAYIPLQRRIQDFGRGEAHLSDCPLPPCNPAHLNDLVSGIEPEIELVNHGAIHC